MSLTRKLAVAAAAITTAIVALNAPPVLAEGGKELNIGSLAPKGTPWMDLLEKMEQQIEAKTDINVIIRPPGIMGEVEMVRETRKGERLQAAAVTTGALSEGGNIPLLQIVELPFLFKDNAQADHVLDNVLWDPMSKILASRGFVLTLWSENGWRSFGTKGEAILKPADLAKFKMRAQESDVHMEMYKALGGNAVQKPMTEVLTSLNSNVIDGLDNTALYIMAGGLAEPLDHFTLTRHIYQPAAVVMSKTWYDQLDPAAQAVLKEARALTQESREKIRTEDDAMIEAMKEMGVEVHALSDAEREAFAVEARKMHDSFAASLDEKGAGTNLLNLIRKGLDGK
ncbi:MAG: TRAP transporter substrate-binding protein [Alphaproteobacteria bacterium]|nr:TRAP transporter substrate-binding protein [Alphaproteobacteria bacterium]